MSFKEEKLEDGIDKYDEEVCSLQTEAEEIV